ncbi:hypothetical protein PF001_g32636 [Phytophthora fragariae]|uniref:Uncharacterized protein n=1 Tax=Phytophthora fragariae TaxID=53985 RepID=A0A6A4ASY7_9STRA|nr:hypothetical protein PF001_g32636 [Phytophthora fragariae]
MWFWARSRQNAFCANDNFLRPGEAVSELCSPNSKMDTCSESKHVTIFPRHAHFTGLTPLQVSELHSSSR